MVSHEPGQERERLAALFELDLLHGGAFPDLDRLVMLAADICSANLAAFTVHDADRAYQVSTSFGARDTMRRDECMCSPIFERGMMIATPDARADGRFATARYVVNPPNVRSFVGVPIGAGDGAVIGVLAIGHTEPDMFGKPELLRLNKVSELVSAFLAQRRAAIRALAAATLTNAERVRQVQFGLIFNAINDGVHVFGADGRIVETNLAAERILGLTRDQQFERAIVDPRWKSTQPDGSPFHPDDFPAARTMRTGETVRDVGMLLELPDGQKRWIMINSAPIFNTDTGAIDYIVATFRDETAHHEAGMQISAQNAQLADALAEAEKASRAKTDFMGVMSHELRTPMNAVLSCALLLSQSRLDPVQKRTLGVLEDAGRQMLAVLNDLLDLSSLNADKVRIEREPASLVRLIEDAAVIWAAEVRAKGLSMSVMIDPALVAPRMVDTARLLQVIGNLMANAIKFTAEGGITIQAWPERGGNGAERVAIEVEDTGPGVPEEAAQRIFSAFEQVDVSSKRRHGGLGLGLHVARRLSAAMGGDVELHSAPGQGSRFTVRIEAPLVTEAPKRQAAPLVANDHDGHAEGEMQARDILCVDDNPRNLYVLGAMLRAAGHRTTECDSGAQALELLAHRKFDVILLDMVMPDMDGLDMLARLRAGGGLNVDTPVIACTANVLPDQVETYRKAGTASVLAKPIDPRAMLEAVAAAA